ncbi:MAG: DUF3575 domain-containing protein [Bacteroides sp.]|nr:DUF3575 domain-containing protein [Bacteroides sp.]
MLSGLSAQNVDSLRSTLSGKSVSADRELVIHFRFDRSTIDVGYKNNRKVLSAFHRLFTDSLSLRRIDSIRISAYTSPEGNPAYNERLAARRADALKQYLLGEYPYLDRYPLHTSSTTEQWDTLRSIVEYDDSIPCGEEILQILSLDAPNARKEFLMHKLNAGIPFRYLSDSIFPNLRNASMCTVYYRPLKHPGAEERAVSVLALPRPCHAERSRSISSPIYAERADASTTLSMTGAGKGSMIGYGSGVHTRRLLFALKTNLLFDAALMPNIELEVPIGKRWSLNGEYMFPWWLMDGDKYCLEILMGGLEGRYWLGDRRRREVLTGHFLSLYAGGGKYDLQWQENGYQGEFFIAAGIGYGWSTAIARNLHLELNLGIGMLRTNYRHYHAQNNYQTLLWQENGRYTWIGPTKAKISLVWTIKN